MFNAIRKWLRPTEPASPASHAKPLTRFRVASDGRHTTVTDTATGHEVCVYAVEFSHDVRHGGKPQLTIRMYQQKFEYEGPGKVFICCPKCREEIKPGPTE